MIFNVLPGIAIVLAGALYVHGTSRRDVPFWRAASFFAGLVAAAAALYGRLDELAHVRFSAHMVQHLLLMTVAAPLVVMGDAGRVLRSGSPRPVVRAVARIPHGVRAGLRSPLVGASAALIALWAWHLPVLYEAALADAGLHWLQHVSFFVTSVLVWAIAFGSRRAREGTALIVLFTTSLAGAALGAIITFAESPLYPTFAGEITRLGLDPLVDQQLAGVIMWIPPGIVNLVAMVILLTRLIEGQRSTPAAAGIQR